MTCVGETFTVQSWCNSELVWAWGIPRGSPLLPFVQRSCWGNDTSPQWGRTWAAAWSLPPEFWSTSSVWRSNCAASWSLVRWSQSLEWEKNRNCCMTVILLIPQLSWWSWAVTINEWKQRAMAKRMKKTNYCAKAAEYHRLVKKGGVDAFHIHLPNKIHKIRPAAKTLSPPLTCSSD